jgi:hypothetical protein
MLLFKYLIGIRIVHVLQELHIDFRVLIRIHIIMKTEEGREIWFSLLLFHASVPEQELNIEF